MVLVTLAADGSVVVSDPGQATTGLGAWLPAGPNRVELTYVTLVSAEDGTLFTVKTSAGAEYDPGADTIAGRYVVTITGPDGNEALDDEGTFHGTRIAVEWPAVPAGEPAATLDAPPEMPAAPGETPAEEPTVTAEESPEETPTAAAP
jgi:hypothetical protein